MHGREKGFVANSPRSKKHTPFRAAGNDTHTSTVLVANVRENSAHSCLRKWNRYPASRTKVTSKTHVAIREAAGVAFKLPGKTLPAPERCG